MKTRKFLAFWAFAGITVLFASCKGGINNVEDSFAYADEVKSAQTPVATTAPGDSCTFSGVLSDTDIAGLTEMREEEKLARDVYIYLYKTHNHVVFNNISKAENAHMSAVLYLMNGYGLTDPALPGEGEFSNPLFADLYKQLTEQGSTDLVAALKVGAFIEEYDIADLQKLIDETENADVKRVYGNLLRGSEFHMRAFTYALKQQGESYVPTIISEEEYQRILNSSDENETETETTTTTTTGTCDGTGPNA